MRIEGERIEDGGREDGMGRLKLSAETDGDGLSGAPAAEVETLPSRVDPEKVSGFVVTSPPDRPAHIETKPSTRIE